MSGINNGLLSLKENGEVDLHNKNNKSVLCLFLIQDCTENRFKKRKIATYLGSVLSSKLLFINI